VSQNHDLHCRVQYKPSWHISILSILSSFKICSSIFSHLLFSSQFDFFSVLSF
jgi:hypothetical protein